MSGADATPPLTLEWLPGTYAVCRLDPSDAVPTWAHPRREEVQMAARLLCITHTDRELSFVVDQSWIPQDANIRCERDFVAMRVAGVLNFSLVGILAKLTGALATANVPVFVMSTFETDLMLVRSHDRSRAVEALTAVARFI